MLVGQRQSHMAGAASLGLSLVKLFIQLLLSRVCRGSCCRGPVCLLVWFASLFFHLCLLFDPTCQNSLNEPDFFTNSKTTSCTCNENTSHCIVAVRQ